MDNNKQLNSLFSFLNGIFSQSIEKIINFFKGHTQSVYFENEIKIEDGIDKIIDTLKTSLVDVSNRIRESNGKIKVEVDIDRDYEGFVKALDGIQETIRERMSAFPTSLSLNEGQDILNVLEKVVYAIDENKIDVDLTGVIKQLVSIKANLGKEMTALRKSIGNIKMPEFPKFPDIPMEDGRIKVILPDNQIVKTVLGKKVYGKVGQFVGGTTVNPNTTIVSPLPAGNNNIGNVDVKFIDTLINGEIDADEEEVVINAAGLGSCGIQISGTWTGAIEFEGTVDGTNWTQARAVQFGGTLVGETAVNGLFFAQIGGLLKFRLRASAWTNGTAIVYLEATAATNAVTLANSLPIGTNVIGSVLPNQYELAGNTVHVKKYYTSAGAVTDGIIWSPAAAKRWYITDIFINVSADATVTLEDDLTAGDSVIWKAELAGNSGWSHSFTTPLYSGEDAADLIITTSAGNVYVMVCGYEI